MRSDQILDILNDVRTCLLIKYRVGKRENALTGNVELPLIYMEEPSWGAEVKKFDFGRVKFEILVRHPSGNVE